MGSLFSWGLLALAAKQISAVPAPTRRQSASVCERIYSVASPYLQSGQSVNFPAEDAYACLKEIPFDADRGVNFVDQLRKSIAWQSTLDLLKSPPDGSKGVDILGGLDDIQQKARTNGYSGQLDFDTDLKNLIDSANDGHFNIAPCSMAIFSFQFDVGLVSVAESTTSQPKIYEAQSIIQDLPLDPIATIDGKDVVEFLEDMAALGNSQDADARYNQLFTNIGRLGNNNTLVGTFAWRGGYYTGYSSINYTTANGTEGTWVGKALIADPSTYTYSSGQQLYDAFCLPPASATGGPPSDVPTSLLTDTIEPTSLPTQTDEPSAVTTIDVVTKRQEPAAPSTTGAPTVPTDPAYFPAAVARDPYNLIAGYFLDGSREDTAVLNIPTFDNNEGFPQNETLTGFIPAASSLIEQAKAAGRTKLIIDLTGNGGGNIMLAADQLDPSLSYVFEFAWQYQLAAPDGGPTNWKSYTDMLGPDGSGLTAPQFFEDFSKTTTQIPGIAGVPLPFQEPPFSADNILLVTDGVCASTCSNFVALMMEVAKVQHTVAWGGRPNTNAMQLVGGVRGSNVLSFDTVANQLGGVRDYIVNKTQEGKPPLTDDQLQTALSLRPLTTTEYPIRLYNGHINFRNAYYNGSDLPLQFDHQAAGCRLFYTAENIRNPASRWTDSAEAVWGNGSKGCQAPPLNITSTATTTSSSSPTESSESSTASATNAGTRAASASMMLAVALTAAVALL
ncbi:uncharacterized protein AB675_9695 [Cyphellophora attinorum]|uniref:CPAF-like PDZ domain-containing protein n=1 Tax=Cyphellophora attinorum TaxID=1664694 RepID=A0A0N0NP23_9EURO|nr:uncharacterized protein AB675_9695 [Phialophora attinorum]KPI42218.1 hypothetical protein AB675_9695 [Phialophora attinorum]